MTISRAGHITRRTALLAAGARLAAGCATAQPATASVWTARAPLPFPVQEIYPAAHKDRIHIAGGLIATNGRVTGVSDRHIAYDPATDASAELGRLPAARHHPQLVSHEGRLYLLGGYGTNPGAVNWIMSAETLVLDEAANSWRTLRPAPAPHAEAVAVGLPGGHIHIFGGRRPKGAANLVYGDHADTDHHLVYQHDIDNWTTAAPALTARNSAAGALIENNWHVVGGRSVTGGPSDAHEVYAIDEDRWRTAAPMPKGSGAGGNAAAVLNGKLYVFGGEYFSSAANAGGVHAEVWCYDPKTDAWAASAPMPTPRHGLGAVALNNAI